MILGGQDVMVDNDKANLWYRKAGTPATKKDIETLPKAYH